MSGAASLFARIGRLSKARRTAPIEPDDGAEPTESDGRFLAGSLTAAELAILDRCRLQSMTSPMRLLALVDAVKHLVRHQIPGDFAECGVWRGGSVLAMVLTLLDLGVVDRDIHLYDTFEGMTQPGDRDVSPFDPPALETWTQAERSDSKAWDYMFNETMFGEAYVRKLLVDTGYPEERLHLHRGDVMETLPGRAPERLALLRLDTDWYESTRHEMEHLFPRIVSGGMLIIDDYGHWQGSRQAVDEYFGDSPPFLHRIDYTGRLVIKS